MYKYSFMRTVVLKLSFLLVFINKITVSYEQTTGSYPTETHFIKTFGGLNDYIGNDMVVSSDGSIIVTGSTYITGKGNSDVLIMKFNSNYTLIWARAIGENGNENGASVTLTIDGSIIVTGIKPTGDGYSDV